MDLVGGLRAVDVAQQAALARSSRQRRGLLVVDRRGACGPSRAGRRRAGSGRAPSTSSVALVPAAGRTRRGRAAGVAADAAAGEAAHELLVGRVDQQHAGRASRPALVERLRRAPRPAAIVRGKPSSRKPSRASLASQALDDHADDHVVGHEVARVHVAPWPRRRARCRRRPPARSMSPVAMYGEVEVLA